MGPKALVRGASAFYGHPIIGAAIRSGADVSVTLRLTKTVKRAVGDAVSGSSLRVEEIFEVGVLVGQVVSFRPGFLCEADDVELVRRAQRCSSEQSLHGRGDGTPVVVIGQCPSPRGS